MLKCLKRCRKMNKKFCITKLDLLMFILYLVDEKAFLESKKRINYINKYLSNPKTYSPMIDEILHNNLDLAQECSICGDAALLEFDIGYLCMHCSIYTDRIEAFNYNKAIRYIIAKVKSKEDNKLKQLIPMLGSLYNDYESNHRLYFIPSFDFTKGVGYHTYLVIIDKNQIPLKLIETRFFSFKSTLDNYLDILRNRYGVISDGNPFC